MANARDAALLCLYKTEYEGAYSNMALKETLLKNRELKKEDKALVTSIVYGVVRYRLTLDYIIKQFSNIKLKKLSGYILIILRMGIYQMIYMDRIPDSAAVNESVKLAKRYGHRASSSYVNAVLRAVIRGIGNISYPENKIEYLSVKYSYPLKLADKWVTDFGADFAQDYMRESNNDAEISIRVNTLKTTAEELIKKLTECGIPASLSGLCPYAVCAGGFDVASSALYRNGYFTVQDISAMLAGEVLSPEEGMTVIDMCAAPGGKTTHLAQFMNNKGKITAFDIHKHKTEIIAANAKRMGINIIESICADSAEFDKRYFQYADRILADVPCSGHGIIRRKPDIKWNEPANFKPIQTAILENAAKYLKPGGELVYSTCTIEHEENEDIIDSFIEKHSEFERVNIEKFLPEKLRKETAKDGFVTFYPNIDGIDGFFICKLRKKNEG